MIMLPSPVRTALEMLESAGYEAYIVGGCVRDSLLGAQPDDYDITTSALPEEVAEVFDGQRIIETGLKHGTQTVLIDGMPLEITTFRVEGTYSDSRHPDSVSFTRSLQEDVSRRDFTMNAIAGTKDGGIADLCGGAEDISKGIIRCVGEPEKRFTEDALRIMRALRFSSVLGFEIEQNTAAAARRCCEGLRKVSAERILVELSKLLCGKNVRRILMEYTDVLGVILPELLPMKGFEQHNPYHIYDVLEHTAAVVESVPAQPVLRMAALLHDIGKPQSFSMDENGVGHFYLHADVSVKLAEKIMRRLKADTASITMIVDLVHWHDVQLEPGFRQVRRRLRVIEPEVFFPLLELKRADIRAQSPDYIGRLDIVDEVERIAREIIEQGQCFTIAQLAVSGRDLMKAGIPEGKKIGRTLSYLLDLVISESVSNEKDALLELAKEYNAK